MASKGRGHGRADGRPHPPGHVKAWVLVGEDGIVQHGGRRHLGPTAVVVHGASLVRVLQIVLHAGLGPEQTIAVGKLDGRDIEAIVLRRSTTHIEDVAQVKVRHVWGDGH